MLKQVVCVFLLLSSYVESCPDALQDGWTQKPVEERVKSAHVVAIGTAVKVQEDGDGHLYGDFQLVEVLKGKNITDEIYVNTSEALFKILGFGSPTMCLSRVNSGETYIVFANPVPSHPVLFAAYSTPFGATAGPTKENKERVIASLGLGQWADWSSCSVSCGGGWQHRTRKCLSHVCTEIVNEKRICNTFNCRGVKNMLAPFVDKLRRNTRSIPPKQHRNALQITKIGNLFVPTNKIYWDDFPQDFSLIASTMFVNYTTGYFISFYDKDDRFQIGISVNRTSLTLEYTEIGNFQKTKEWKLSFDVEIVDNEWHQFAFSVQNGVATLYYDCVIYGTKEFKPYSMNKIDINGNVYLSGKSVAPPSHESDVEFYVDQLSISDDPLAASGQCESTANKDPYGYEEMESSGKDDEETVEKEPIYEWTSWTSCSQTCGEHGVRKRVKILRICIKSVINNTYSECMKGLQHAESESCNRKKCPAQCQQYCMNGGVCYEKNKCRCPPEYYGLSCEKVVPCKVNCQNGGRCIPSTNICQCPKGFTGKLCSKAICDPPCKNGGICVKPGVCKCGSGYLPPLCKPLCYPPCKNQGVCIMPGRCHCKAGYFGRHCERAICTKPCLNGGRCYNRNKCICKSGWTGETCNIAICHPGCQNGGYCRAPNFCSCPVETSGTYCQNVACRPRCLNGGTCIPGNRCQCSSSHTGDQCQTPLCVPKCENGGTCVAQNQCECPSGYYGDACQTRLCTYKTRVVPRKITKVVPLRYFARCSPHSPSRLCTERRIDDAVVYVTKYRIEYYCG